TSKETSKGRGIHSGRDDTSRPDPHLARRLVAQNLHIRFPESQNLATRELDHTTPSLFQGIPTKVDLTTLEVNSALGAKAKCPREFNADLALRCCEQFDVASIDHDSLISQD